MNEQIYRSTGKKTLFDAEFSVEKLSEIGNPLEKIGKAIDFEMFREVLEGKLPNLSKKNNAGAKPFDVVLMFKIMILQRYYGLGGQAGRIPDIGQDELQEFPGTGNGRQGTGRKNGLGVQGKIDGIGAGRGPVRTVQRSSGAKGTDTQPGPNDRCQFHGRAAAAQYP